jgi:hypothetical protein
LALREEYPGVNQLAAESEQPVKSAHEEAAQAGKLGPLFMNQKQKKILIATAVLIVALLLFPPFQVVFPARVVNLGYGFLLYPPRYSSLSGSVNTALLLAEVLIAILVGGLLAFAYKDKK